MKDWTGNSKTVYSILGASNHSETEREEYDYYATDPHALDKLLDNEGFYNRIWECAVGGGHLSNRLKERGYYVFRTDIVDRGFNDYTCDFFNIVYKHIPCDIITNPPYNQAKEFVEHALDLIQDGRKVAMFLKLTFLEGQQRRKLFDKNPPKDIYVFTKRQVCAKNGDFELAKKQGSAVCYAWFVWRKGYEGSPRIHWI